MGKKKLVIFTEAFPYDTGESFLETEVNFIKGFEEVIICSCDVQNSKSRRIIYDEKIKVEMLNRRFKSKFINKIFYIGNCFFSLFSVDTIKEILKLKKERKLDFRTFKKLIDFTGKARICLKNSRKILLKNKIDNKCEIIFYSYWMYYHAYVALKLKREYYKSMAITRCHGYDLYEYRSYKEYIPFRKFIIGSLDYIYCVSNDGKEYINKKYSNLNRNSNVKMSRLGTKDFGVQNTSLKDDIFRIVSCSRVVEVKRINRIISSLSLIKGIKIHWIHYGDGHLYNEIESMANSLLQNNISFELYGEISNDRLLQQYQTSFYDVFVNVSETEGIPVSIMEAISFGIPVIATDVGGVKEIVQDRFNGYLLVKDFKDEQLAKKIEYMYSLSKEKSLKLRKNSRKLWKENYNAEQNYTNFVASINS